MGACWMQISDWKFVCATLKATSHGASISFFMYPLFVFKPMSLITWVNAAKPKIKGRMIRGKDAWKTIDVKHGSRTLSNILYQFRLCWLCRFIQRFSQSKIHNIHSVIHANTKPPRTKWVGQVQNGRKPPAFKQHSIEEVVPISTTVLLVQ